MNNRYSSTLSVEIFKICSKTESKRCTVSDGIFSVRRDNTKDKKYIKQPPTQNKAKRL